jgi:hypothetical protein
LVEAKIPEIETKVLDSDFDKLVAAWHNALLNCDRERAEKALNVIEEEWQYREVDISNEEPLWDTPSDVVPDEGLLGILGYHVGITRRQKAALRQKILLRISVAKLPIVHSLFYMKDWGQPSTRKRKLKIVGTITGYIEQKCKYAIYDNAIRDWRKDLCAVEKKFYP